MNGNEHNKDNIVAEAQKAAGLRRIPQRGISVYEMLLYCILPFILIMAGVMPTTALCLIPIALVLLYALYRRFGAIFPLVCIAFYGLLALVINYDILTVIYFVGLTFAFIGLVFSCRLSAYLASIAAAAIIAIFGGVAGVAVVRLAENKPISDIAAEYVIEERDDPVIAFFARDYYDALRLPSDEVKLKRGDEGYEKAAAEAFSEWAGDEFMHYIWYYCIHYGALFGCIGFFAAVVINRRTASCNDVDATEEETRLSTRALGGARITGPIADMRVPRSYLYSCVLPAFVAAFILYFVGGYDFLTSTVTHTFVTLPSAFACYTLFAFFASLFKGKARVAATVILVIIGIAAALFPMALFVLAVLGLCDCILDLRFWTRYIMEP